MKLVKDWLIAIVLFLGVVGVSLITDYVYHSEVSIMSFIIVVGSGIGVSMSMYTAITFINKT